LQSLRNPHGYLLKQSRISYELIGDWDLLELVTVCLVTGKIDEIKEKSSLKLLKTDLRRQEVIVNA
jgi:hypothetical protein